MTMHIAHTADFVDSYNACACGHSACEQFEGGTAISTELEDHIIDAVRALLGQPSAAVQVGSRFADDGAALWECQW